MLRRSGLFILLFLLAWVELNQANYRRIGSFGVKLKPNGAYRVRTKGKSHTAVEIHTSPEWRDRHVHATHRHRLSTCNFAFMRRVFIHSKMSYLEVRPEASLWSLVLYKSMIPWPLPCTTHGTERSIKHISFCSTISNVSWNKSRFSIDMMAFQRVHVMKVRNHVFHVAQGMLSLSYHPSMTSSVVREIGPIFGKQALAVKRYLCSRWKGHGTDGGWSAQWPWANMSPRTGPGGAYGYMNKMFQLGRTRVGYMNGQWISSDQCAGKANMKSDCSCSFFTLTCPPPRHEIKVARVIIHRNIIRQTHGTKSFFVQFPLKKSTLSLDFYHDSNAMISYGKMPPIPIQVKHLALPLFTPSLSNSKHAILHIFQTMTIHQSMQCNVGIIMVVEPYQISQYMTIREDEVQLIQFAQTARNMRTFPTTLQFITRHHLQHKYITMQKRCKQSWKKDNVCTGVQSSSALPTFDGPYTHALISKLYTKRCYHWDMCVMQCMRSLVIVDLYAPPCVKDVMVMVEEEHRLLSFATMTKVISVEHQKSTISHHSDHLGYDANTIVIEQL